MEKNALNLDDVTTCIRTLEQLVTHGDQLTKLSEAQRIALMKAAGQLTRPGPQERRAIGQ